MVLNSELDLVPGIYGEGRARIVLRNEKVMLAGGDGNTSSQNGVFRRTCHCVTSMPYAILLGALYRRKSWILPLNSPIEGVVFAVRQRSDLAAIF